MKIYMISFTENGNILNDRIKNVLTDYDVRAFYKNTVWETTKEWTRKAFSDGDALIYIGASGIAIRSIASFIKRKDTDPAVIVCDEKGKFVVPVLSGHIGGANLLASKIAERIGAVPVITTATDINGVWAVDNWAAENSYSIYNIEDIKYISGGMLEKRETGIVSDIEVDDELPENVIFNKTDTECGIVVSPFIKKVYRKTLNIIPKCLYIGVGSKKGADENALIDLLNDVAKKYNLDLYGICGVATIDAKKSEKCVLKLCDYLKTDLKCFSAEELNSAEGDFESSDFVMETVGTDNVCERSAVLAAGGQIAVHKTKGKGVTLAICYTKGHL